MPDGFFRGNLHKLHPIHCYGECGRVQVTEQMSTLLGREDLWGQWEFQTTLQTLASQILGADAVISARGGVKHRRYCPECQEKRDMT